MGLIVGALAALLLGATSVLPLSASGHLVLIRVWIDTPDELAATLTCSRLGVALALFLVLREERQSILRFIFVSIGLQDNPPNPPKNRNGLALIVAAAVALALHLSLTAPAQSVNHVPTVAGLGALASAAMLASLAFAPTPHRLSPHLAGALGVGLAHGLGIVPGASGIAAAFATLGWLGVSRWDAARFSLMVAWPTLLVDAIAGWRNGQPWSELSLARGLLVALLAFLAAWFSCQLFRSLCDKRHSYRLAWWLTPVAISLLLYGQVLPPTSHAPQAKETLSSHTAHAHGTTLAISHE